MEIVFDENVKIPDKIYEAAEEILDLETIENGDGEVSLSFVSPEEIRKINREYRDKDAVTDVLSFPQYERKEDIPCEGYYLLGDVIICMDKAISQAKEYGHSTEREIVYLFTHSMFHLLSYDHMTEEDKKTMREKEEEVMERIGLSR